MAKSDRNHRQAKAILPGITIRTKATAPGAGKIPADLQVNTGSTQPKRHTLLAVLLAVILALTGMTVAVFATDATHDTAGNAVPGVSQGSDKYEFLSPASNGTIDLDLNVLGDRSVMTQAAMKPVLTEEATNMGLVVTQVAEGGQNVWYVGVDGNVAELKHDVTNYFNGDLFSYTYKNAATLPNGDKANVKIAFSDMELELWDSNHVSGGDKLLDDYKFKNNIALIASGTKLWAYATNAYTNDNLTRYGFRIKIKTQIVDDQGNPIQTVTIDGKQVPATFYYPMVDIDVTGTATPGITSTIPPPSE